MYENKTHQLGKQSSQALLTNGKTTENQARRQFNNNPVSLPESRSTAQK